MSTTVPTDVLEHCPSALCTYMLHTQDCMQSSCCRHVDQRQSARDWAAGVYLCCTHESKAALMMQKSLGGGTKGETTTWKTSHTRTSKPVNATQPHSHHMHRCSTDTQPSRHLFTPAHEITTSTFTGSQAHMRGQREHMHGEPHVQSRSGLAVKGGLQLTCVVPQATHM